jgi:hypothetical protein
VGRSNACLPGYLTFVLEVLAGSWCELGTVVLDECRIFDCEGCCGQWVRSTYGCMAGSRDYFPASGIVVAKAMSTFNGWLVGAGLLVLTLGRHVTS